MIAPPSLVRKESPFLKLAICFFLIFVTLMAFSQVRHNQFINLDDNLYVTDNPHVKKGLSVRGVVWAFTRIYAGHWHPLTWLSHMLDYDLYKLNPAGHHLTNLLIHLVNTVLLFLLFQRMTGATLRSGFVAALFALHPLHVESVAWVAERKDLLCALFSILAIRAYVRYVERPGLSRYLFVLLCLVLSLMSKPMAVTLPFVLLLLDYWPLGRMTPTASKSTSPRRKDLVIFQPILEKIPLLFLSAMMSFFTLFTHSKSGAVASLERLSLDIRIGNALVSYIMYISKMIWPTRLAVLYPHPMALPIWQVAGAALAVAGITTLAILTRRKYPYGLVGWFWYLGTLVPVIGLVQAGPQAMADRFTYLPLIGLFLIVSHGVPDILKEWHYRNILLLGGAGVVILILMLTTISQVKHWKDSLSLFHHTLNVTGNNPIIHNNLGVTLMRQGREEEAGFHFRRALMIRPLYVDAHHNLGLLLNRQGRVEEAIAHFLQALQINPKMVLIHNDLAIILYKQGRRDEAIFHLSEALRINPDSGETHLNLGVVMLHQERYQEALTHLSEALRINPHDAKAHHNLGVALANLGKVEEAIVHYTQALRIDPGYADTHCNLGSLLSRQGKYEEAKAHYHEALRINPRDPQVHYAMGVILARQRKDEEALFHFNEAVRIKPHYGEAHLAIGMLYLIMGRKEMALREYRILKTIDPNLAKALHQRILEETH
ncbi:MAG: tetratricopeptide repeat protein [Syntrophaceae bacterium]|nr:tetratricopeptide repeat protein [Syntrophaceae bacterium]